MKAIVLFFFFFAALQGYSQKLKDDSLKYIYYIDEFGKKKKAVVATPPQILIVAGDSIYTVSNEFQLKRILEKQEGFNIINDSDSICLFLRHKIKAVVILGKKAKK